MSKDLCPNCRAETLGVVFLVIIMISGVVAAIVFVGRPRESRLMLLVGAVVAWVVGSAVLFIVAAVPREWVELLMLLSLAIGGLLILWLACRRGGLTRAKSFLVGYMAGFISFGAVVLLLPVGRMQLAIATAFGALGFLLWPALLSIVALQNFWSWDDAFPQVVSPARQTANSTRTQDVAAVIAGEVGGIEFFDGPSGGET